MKGQVESIAVYDSNLSQIVTAESIYRYKVKEVQLVSKSDSENVLTFTKDFKYYYANEEYGNLSKIARSSSADLSYYFPLLDFQGNYCKSYGKDAAIIIVLDKIDKVYRPKYSIKNNVLTAEFYTINTFENVFSGSSSSMSQRCYKKEYDYNKYYNAYTEYLSNIASNPDKYTEISKDAKEKYEAVAAIIWNKQVANTNNLIVNVEFHK